MVCRFVEFEGIAAGISKEGNASSWLAKTIGTQRPITPRARKENSAAPAGSGSPSGTITGRQKTCFHRRLCDPARRAEESHSRSRCCLLAALSTVPSSRRPVPEIFRTGRSRLPSDKIFRNGRLESSFRKQSTVGCANDREGSRILPKAFAAANAEIFVDRLRR